MPNIRQMTDMFKQGHTYDDIAKVSPDTPPRPNIKDIFADVPSQAMDWHVPTPGQGRIPLGASQYSSPNTRDSGISEQEILDAPRPENALPAVSGEDHFIDYPSVQNQIHNIEDGRGSATNSGADLTGQVDAEYTPSAVDLEAVMVGFG